MRRQAFRRLGYPTPPEHVHADHVERAWAASNERVAARLGEKVR
jgi:hypothetical protein